VGELRFEQRNVDYVHIDGADPTNGFGNKSQLKTPRSTGTSESRGTGNVGCGNSSGSGGLPWGRDKSRYPLNGGVGFVTMFPSEEIEGWRCRFEGDGETHCESLRLRIPCTGT
jgi:hypothetical protein